MAHTKTYIVFGADTSIGEKIIKQLLEKQAVRIFGVCPLLVSSKHKHSDTFIPVNIDEDNGKELEEKIQHITEKGKRKIAGVIFIQASPLPHFDDVLDSKCGKVLEAYTSRNWLYLQRIFSCTHKHMAERGNYSLVVASKDDSSDGEVNLFYSVLHAQKTLVRNLRKNSFFHEHHLSLCRYVISTNSLQECGESYLEEITERVLHGLHSGRHIDTNIR